MKKRCLFKVACTLLFLIGGRLGVSAQTNIALSADVSTSFVSSWETLGAVNDGKEPSSSTDKSNGAYGNWNGESDYDTYNYVQYSWASSHEITSTMVYWWDDGAGIDQPTSAYIQYYNNGSWVTVADIGKELNRYNTLSLNISTTGLRIYMKSAMATGILEWKVLGPTSASTSFQWPEYSPNISYNFKDEYGSISMPTNILNDCAGVVGTQSSEWWTFRWGASANSLVTSNAITPMLERLNTDFAYFRDVMGWPPDDRALNGYKSAVYLYGSGLCTDNASNTELGGWQSGVYYNGKNWPMILASYYPVYSFDPACPYSDKESQQSAMVHEGIHSVLASMPGCRNAAWFHEGGNTWLQQEADSRKTQNYSSMGFLNGAAMIAPFMPIECYSGWLQDGSFGGPSAEGVNMTNSSGNQVCTWRTFLGGTQYGNVFPTFLGQALGDGSVAWIWKNCPSRVLEGMADGLGESQIRRLISEYRAKQAVVDFGKWTNALTNLLNSRMGTSIGAEWQPYWLETQEWIATPYVNTTNANGILTPEKRTTPGWSGANQIPLKVSGDVVAVNFQPIGENMTCQLCYIATNGTRVYSPIVTQGNCSLNLDLAPANNVVIAVITNTNYIYEGEETRKAHYDYRLGLGDGVTGTADIHTAWYNGTSLKTTTKSTGDYYDVSKYCSHNHSIKQNTVVEGAMEEMEVFVYPNPASRDDNIKVEILNTNLQCNYVEVVNLQGQVVYSNKINGNSFDLKPSGNLRGGMYWVTVKNPESSKTFKIIIR